jgi:hypothetical protein
MSIYPEHMHTHPTHMSTSEKLDRLDPEIHKIDHQDYLTIDGTSPPTKKIISINATFIQNL